VPGYELIGNEEFQEIANIFDNGAVLFRHGFDHLRNGVYKVREFEDAFARRLGVDAALAVSSGTAALRVALAGLGIGPGDDVVTQSFTFVATVEAIIEAGARPICTEVDATLNMDPADLERRLTPATRAVIVVHMLGTPARLTEILDICRRRGIPLIEDTAWGCGGRLLQRPLGTWGTVGTFSFDAAKTLTTGEGGMVISSDTAVLQRARAWHDHGHENNPALPRWEDSRRSSGFNYRMSELQGAVGLAQLRKLDTVIEGQRRTRDAIWEAIRDLRGVTPREVPDGSEETADALVFFVDSRERALACRASLLDAGLGTKILPEAHTWHFAGTWQHMPQLAGAHGGDLSTAFPQTSALLSRTVSLPIFVRPPLDQPGRVRGALHAALAATVAS
jgi:8-amino-3,8-dideoxy-alpha-D-manno-octulosonate transaminase